MTKKRSYNQFKTTIGLLKEERREAEERQRTHAHAPVASQLMVPYSLPTSISYPSIMWPYQMTGINQSYMPHGSAPLPMNFFATGHQVPVSINITAPINIYNNTFHQSGQVTNNLDTKTSNSSSSADSKPDEDTPSFEYLGDSGVPSAPSADRERTDDSASVEGGGQEREEEEQYPSSTDSNANQGEVDDSATIGRVGDEEEDLLRAASANDEGGDNSVGRQRPGWMCECKHLNPPFFQSCGQCDRIKNSGIEEATAAAANDEGADNNSVGMQEGEVWMCECKHENPSLFVCCEECGRFKILDDISVIDLTGPDEADSEVREASPAGHATIMPDGEDFETIMDRTRDYLGPRYCYALLERYGIGAAAGNGAAAGTAGNGAAACGARHTTPKNFGMDIIVQSECAICQKCIGDERCKCFPTCGHTFHKNCINEWIQQRLLKKKEPTCPNCRKVFEENEDG